ncbi:MAG: OmpH family outer membrane protein [Bacteroidia bacterium]|nr:OmpH family outer membrane protein [Bacteroidia bacterium]
MNRIIIGLSLTFSVAALVISLALRNKYELVYIDAGRIYSDFQMSKELTKQAEIAANSRKHITDSLMERFRIKSGEIKFQKKPKEEDIIILKQLEDEFVYRNEEFEKQNRDMITTMNTKIWNQINQYVSDFGRQKNYSFIFGANGQGNLMFANKELDLTDEVVGYINNRYNDKTTK